MTNPTLGKIRPVGVREVWPHEAEDFTPWLAQNLSELGKALRMDLELVHQEEQVGDFSLDIRAREVNQDCVVAIENQLEWTDHSHLGQLLTYAAGVDARIVVWLASEFREEHRAAIDWLNNWTSEEVQFYGVEVHVIKIGDSLPAPQFRPVAFPNGWSRRTRTVSRTTSPENQRYRDFFQPLVDDLRREGFTDQAYAKASRDQSFSSEIPGIQYVAELAARKEAWVYLFIHNTEDKKLNLSLFDALKEEGNTVEKAMGTELQWLRREGFGYPVIGLSRHGSIDDPEDKLAEIRAWMLDYLVKSKEVFDPRLRRMIS